MEEQIRLTRQEYASIRVVIDMFVDVLVDLELDDDEDELLVETGKYVSGVKKMMRRIENEQGLTFEVHT